MNLEFLSAKEIGDKVNNRELTALQVVDYFLDRISRLDHSVNAVTYVMPDDARAAASRIDKRVLYGEHLPFAGVPFLLKDFLDSKKGWTNSHGGVKSLVREDVADSEFCKAAEALGAVAIGKANAPAFGFSGKCDNKLYGSTRNPFDLSRTSGGSSGGSAAAVASGLVPIAEGGDAGGSIRIPASWCNLFGFKPSLGTVPSYCRPDGWAATHPYCFNGSLTKTVEDSAIMLTRMARYDPRDPISLPINSNKDFEVLMKKPIKGMKVGFTFDFGLWPVSSAVQDVVWKAARRFEEDCGAEVTGVNFNFNHSINEILRCWAWAISVDTVLDLEYWRRDGLDLINDHNDELPLEFIKYNMLAKDASIFDMREFNEIRTDILDNFEDAFEKVDAIVSPVAICRPMKLDDADKPEFSSEELDPEYKFINFAETPLANFIGYPAASVPAGLTSDNLPVGMQIIGKQYHDEDVMAFSYAFEQVQPWRDNYKLSYLN